jgi:hypothetical protein
MRAGVKNAVFWRVLSSHLARPPSLAQLNVIAA